MTILVAIDEHKRSKQAVTIGYDLAEAYETTLTALHVVPQDNYEEHRDAIRRIHEFREFSIEQEVKSAEKFAREFVISTIDDPDMTRIEPYGRVGDVTDEILAASELINPRYLVVSGRQRTPTGKAIFGNKTQQILLNASCPVVTKLSE